MARGRTLGELIDDLRADSGRSTEPAHGLNDRARLMAIIRRAYAMLYADYDWPHLRVSSTKIMAAGQRYYDFPTVMNAERVEEVWRKWGGDWDEGENLTYGIERGDYAAFDSDAGVRSDPISKWQFYNDGSVNAVVQFEVWPMPASDVCQIKFIGTKKEATLTQESHRCDLDDTPILGFSRALLAPMKEREGLFAIARQPLIKQKARLDKSGSFRKGGRLDEGTPQSRTDARFRYVR